MSMLVGGNAMPRAMNQYGKQW